MNTNTDRVRLAVFKIWFVTLTIVLLVYAAKFVPSLGVTPPFASTFQSLQMMIGLVVPQIGVMVAFYFNLDKQKDKIDALSDEQITVITWLSAAYHVIFNATLVAGIVFYAFDRSADGNSLQRNTAAVMAIMGLFSLFLTPIAFLFARPKQ
jgi:hypothetical protein